MGHSLPRKLLAEYLGSLSLAAVVIGSGIAAQTLSPHDVGLQLLENAAVTALGLYTIILVFGPVSGGHFNPVVSLADSALGGLSWRRRVFSDTFAGIAPASVLPFVAAQLVGGVVAIALLRVLYPRPVADTGAASGRASASVPERRSITPGTIQ